MTRAATATDATSAEPPGNGVFDTRPGLLVATLVAMFLLAAVVRVDRIDAPGVLLDRDFTSAVFARDFYFRHADDVEPWRKEVAHATRLKQPTLEPPVTEWLAAQVYRVAGKEDIRYARLLTITFMLAGGWFLFRTTQRLVSTDAAVFALAYYLFLPHMILLSRSFQADALMMLMYLASLSLLVRHHEAPTPQRLLAAAALAGATLLYRPLVLFALVGAFVLPVIQRRGFWRGAFDRSSLVYVAIAVLPAALYYGYLTVVAQNFGWKLASSFRPDLLAQREYWQGWHELIVLAVGTMSIVMAAAGAVLLRPGLARPIVLGLALGYLAFGALFTTHIHTHGYYQAQLVPLVAVAASPLAVLAARACLAAPGTVAKLAAAVVVGFFLALPAVREWREGLAYSHEESPQVAREIGRLVGHSQRVVFLSPYYGMPLQYYGEFTGSYWPRPITSWPKPDRNERALSVAERLAAIRFEPEYFVVTAFKEFERHHRDLAAYLESRCRLKARAPDYLVYDACLPPEPGGSRDPATTADPASPGPVAAAPLDGVGGIPAGGAPGPPRD